MPQNQTEMAQTNEGRDIEMATISNNNGGAPPHSAADRGHTTTSTPSNATTDEERAPEYSKVQHKFLSKTAKLLYFLPTGTSMLFEATVPKIYRNGQCSHMGKIMMWVLLGLCVVICFLSQFTDSYKQLVTDSNKTSDEAKDGKKKVVYKFVKPSEWKIEDGVHVLMSVAAFLTIAFSDQRVVDRMLPAYVKEVEEVMLSLEVIVLSICSFLYFAFPVKRTGLVPKMEKKENKEEKEKKENKEEKEKEEKKDL